MQKPPSDVCLQFDTATFLSFISACDEDAARLVSTRVPRSVFHAEVTALLDELTPANVRSTAHALAQWMNLAKGESDCATVTQIIDLVFTKATSNWDSTRVCAYLCQQLRRQISHRAQDCGVGQVATDTWPAKGVILYDDRLDNKFQTEIESIRSKMHLAASSLETSGSTYIISSASS